MKRFLLKRVFIKDKKKKNLLEPNVIKTHKSRVISQNALIYISFNGSQSRSALSVACWLDELLIHRRIKRPSKWSRGTDGKISFGKKKEKKSTTRTEPETPAGSRRSSQKHGKKREGRRSVALSIVWFLLLPLLKSEEQFPSERFSQHAGLIETKQW